MAVTRVPRLSLDHLIDQADQALYRAKRAGRNRCTLFEPSQTAAAEAAALAASLEPQPERRPTRPVAQLRPMSGQDVVKILVACGSEITHLGEFKRNHSLCTFSSLALEHLLMFLMMFHSPQSFHVLTHRHLTYPL